MADRAARWLIVAGGIGTILAVSVVCIFLVWVVIPLFLPAKIEVQQASTPTWAAKAPLHVALAPDQLLGWALEADGSLACFRPDDGALIARQPLLAETPPTAAAFGHTESRAVFGLADGSVRMANLNFVNSFLAEDRLPDDLRRLEQGQLAAHDGGILTRTPAGQLRLEKLSAELEAPIKLSGSEPIRLIDYTARPTGEMFCVLDADGHLQLHATETRENLLTGENVVDVTGTELPLTLPAGKGPPDYLLLSDLGDHVYVAWRDGTLLHFDTRDFDNPKLAEQIDLVPDPAQSLTALEFLLGKIDALGRRFERAGEGLVLPQAGRQLRRAGPSGCGAHAARRRQTGELSGRIGQFAAAGRGLCRSIGARVLLDQSTPGAQDSAAGPTAHWTSWHWLPATTA